MITSFYLIDLLTNLNYSQLLSSDVRSLIIYKYITKDLKVSWALSSTSTNQLPLLRKTCLLKSLYYQ